MLRKSTQCIFLLLALTSVSRAQSCDFKKLMLEGKAFLEKGIPEYRNALSKLSAARTCDPSKSQEVDREITRLFRLIEGERDKAVIAEKNVKDALAKLQSAQISLKKERDRALQAEQLASEALEKLQLTLVDVARLIVRDAKELILRLDYEDAYVKLKNAASMNVLHDSVAYALMETAFFFHYGGRTNLARESFNFAAQLLGKPGFIESEDFGSEIQRLCSESAAFLKQRYFPSIANLPGGAFTMGRDSIKGVDYKDIPEHKAYLDPFGLAQTEITYWQLNLFFAAKGRDISKYHPPSWGVWGDNPAVGVDWFLACEYANWFSGLEGKKPFYQIDGVEGTLRAGWRVTQIPGANGYRLPTEAEWEYAARGGIDSLTYQYAGSDSLDLVAWHNGNSRWNGVVNRTHPVGVKLPVVFLNGAKIYDLTGNVWEWCWDVYYENYYENYHPSISVNPTGPEEFSLNRVLRGGSWYRTDPCYDISIRFLGEGNTRSWNWGFRIARTQ